MSTASGSSRRVKRAAKSGRRTRRQGIDFSDLPEMSDEQLRSMRRVGRPPLGTIARRLIAIRIDAQVLVALQREASRRGVGYQTLIHQLLAKHVARRRSA